jgi:hypothetical protein
VKHAVLPRNLRLSILIVQLVTIATLMRSIAFDRWITILASLVLLVGAAAAKRNRAWGVALMFAQAAAFPMAYLIGIAPSWFCLVGAVGMIPFMLTAPGFARLDRGATRLLAALAVAGGSIGAIVWKQIAWDVFRSVPFFWPSGYPHHGWAVAGLAALGVAIAVRDRKLVDAEGAEVAAHARVALPARLAVDDRTLANEEEVEHQAEEVLAKRQQR